VSGSGINWAICKSAPRLTQITTPAPQLSVFYGWMPFLPPNQQRQSTDGSGIIACIMLTVNYVDAVAIDNSKETPRSTAEASGAVPWVNPLTKEQLQQAFIYLLQVLMLCSLSLMNSVRWYCHCLTHPTLLLMSILMAVFPVPGLTVLPQIAPEENLGG